MHTCSHLQGVGETGPKWQRDRQSQTNSEETPLSDGHTHTQPARWLSGAEGSSQAAVRVCLSVHHWVYRSATHTHTHTHTNTPTLTHPHPVSLFPSKIDGWGVSLHQFSLCLCTVCLHLPLSEQTYISSSSVCKPLIGQESDTFQFKILTFITKKHLHTQDVFFRVIFSFAYFAPFLKLEYFFTIISWSRTGN